MDWKKYFRRLLLIEIVVFGFTALGSWALGIPFSSGLFLVGSILIVMAFTGSSSASRLQGVGNIGSNTMEDQLVRDVKDAEQIGRIQRMVTDVIAIGGIPILVGVVIAMLG